MKPLMMGLLIALFTVGFPACPPPTPAVTPVTDDAGPVIDAAPGPVTEAAPGPVVSDCKGACNALVMATCPLGSKPDCETVLSRDLGSGKYPNAATGKPLTCVDMKSIRTKADAVRLNFTCQ
jgi:hypothetical protein